jgi:hypothetical protein
VKNFDPPEKIMNQKAYFQDIRKGFFYSISTQKSSTNEKIQISSINNPKIIVKINSTS